MSQLKRFPYPGAIDADGHILEPPDLWEKYIDPKYRDRTIRIRKGQDGLEVLELDGGPARYIRPEALAQFGAMGKREEVLTPHPDRTYVDMAPFGSMDSQERLSRMDEEGLEKAIIVSQPWSHLGSGRCGRPRA